MLALVHDADVLDDPEPCGWLVPDLWRDVLSGVLAVRFRCSGCGALGGWAIGQPSAVGDLVGQARALGPHAG